MIHSGRKKIKLKPDCRKNAGLSMTILLSLTWLRKKLPKHTGSLSNMQKYLIWPCSGLRYAPSLNVDVSANGARKINRVLALHLVRTRQLILAQAAKRAKMDLPSFIELLGASGIDAVDYPPNELDQELENALAACGHR